MTSILRQAIFETRQEWRAAIKTFWFLVPSGVLFLLARALIAHWPYDQAERDLFNSLSIAIGVLSIALLLLASIAAVAWHRRLILREEYGWLLPWPRRQTFSYVVLVVGFAIVYWLILLPAGFVREIIFALLFGKIGPDGAAAWSSYLLGFGPFGNVLVTLSVILAEAAVLALYLLLCASALLSLPCTAVGEKRLSFDGRPAGLRRRMLIALLIAYGFPVAFAAILNQLVVADGNRGFREETAFMLATAAATLMGFILSLSILSVSYRTMREVQGERMNQ